MPYRSHLDPGQLAALVVCPNCQVGMRVKRVAPVMFTTDVVEMVYDCPKCRAETKRHVRERRSPKSR